jgi:TonB family protein
MNAFGNWVLGYLLNSLWEVPAIFAAAWLAAWMVRRIGPQPELDHRIWVGALTLEAFLPACRLDTQRFAVLLELLERAFSGKSPQGTGVTTVVMGVGSAEGHGVLHLPAVVLIGIMVVYALTLAYFAGRLAWGLWRTYLMQRQVENLTLQGDAALCVDRCSALLGIGPIHIAVSKLLTGPVTVGVFRQMLLMPTGFFEKVAVSDLEALVAHEFAHIQRRDFLKNLAYGAITLPVSYHPVLWLTRARVAESRELVCDAIAAGAVKGRERYARSLLRLASMLADQVVSAQMEAKTLHAIGIFDANIFERRIMTLTQKCVEINRVRRIAGAVSCVVLGMATCASALALRMDVASPVVASSGMAADGSNRPAHVSGAVMAGQVLTKVPPVYPQDAKDAKITGAVVLQAVIGKDGVIENLQVVSGPEKLRTSSLDAVRQWTYKPYLLNGEPTEVQTTITVNYSLRP